MDFNVNPAVSNPAHKKIKFFSYILLLGLACSDPSPLHAQGEVMPEVPPAKFREPSILEIKPPIYPVREQRRGIEGWVILEFCVTLEGSVKNIKVDSQTGPEVFVERAIAVLEQARFEPAQSNGVPIEYCGQQQQVTFALGGPSARPTFVSLYREANEAIIANDLDTARVHINTMAQKDELNLYEQSWINFARALIAVKEAKTVEALSFFEKSLFGDGRYLDLETAGIALSNIFIIKFNSQQYGEALDIYRELQEMEKKPENYETIKNVALALMTKFEGNETFSLPLVLDEDGAARYVLFRKKVSLQPNGDTRKAEEVQLDCRQLVHEKKYSIRSTGYSEKYAFEFDHIWESDPTSGSCTLYIRGGQPGQKLNLIQHPDA